MERKYSGYRDMAVTGNAIVLTDSRSHLFAVDRRNGLELWSDYPAGKPHCSPPPSSSGDDVVVGDVEGYLYWLDRTDGTHQGHAAARQQWSLCRSAGGGSAPLYVQSRDGKL